MLNERNAWNLIKIGEWSECAYFFPWKIYNHNNRFVYRNISSFLNGRVLI